MLTTNVLSKEARRDTGIVVLGDFATGFLCDDRTELRQLRNDPDRWVFARRRTITGMLAACDAVQRERGPACKHHSPYHRLFAVARWSLDELGLAVFDLITPWLPVGPILLAIDDTLARKRGLKVLGAGMHHDPLISTRKVALTNWGHSWVVLGVIVRFPFNKQCSLCLPFFFRLYVNKKTTAKKRLRYCTRPELAVEMLDRLCGAHKSSQFHTIADSASGGKSVYLNLPDNCALTSRLDLDARLHEAAPARRGRKSGHPRKRDLTPRFRSGSRVVNSRSWAKDGWRSDDEQEAIHDGTDHPQVA